jgi:dGTPase
MEVKNRQALWASLLSAERLYGLPRSSSGYSQSEYQKDYERIIFSSAFRRLQDKTQVFPLSQSDYTRTRLTHTLEVSSVGRTLGTMAAKYLIECGVVCDPEDVGTIVATAALAHDIGNPPFGHSGEAAIQYWAKKQIPGTDNQQSDAEPRLTARRKRVAGKIPIGRAELADLHLFEGNAQGLRILVRTAARTRSGGLRPTIATLGAMAKYPRPSFDENYMFNAARVSEKKPGYFQHERAMAIKAFSRLGLVEKSPGIFARHPLAFLMEAADDICYAIADVEDAFKLGIVTFEDVRAVLFPMALLNPNFHDMEFLDPSARISRFRSAALHALVSEVLNSFRDSLGDMELGRLDQSLIERSKAHEPYQSLKSLARQKVYRHERVLQIEYAGFQTLSGLLSMFYSALCEEDNHLKNDKLRKMFPRDLTWRPNKPNRSAGDRDDPVLFSLQFMTQYERVLAVTDYVSGMTDGFAIQLFQRLSGIKLPE